MRKKWKILIKKQIKQIKNYYIKEKDYNSMMNTALNKKTLKINYKKKLVGSFSKLDQFHKQYIKVIKNLDKNKNSKPKYKLWLRISNKSNFFNQNDKSWFLVKNWPIKRRK